jgi:RimJ/RimL family protein N-acetyltransferase
MTKACGLVVRHAFVPTQDGGLGLSRVTAYAGVDNRASRHVIEANGFKQYGVERRGLTLGDGTPTGLACYDLLLEEWAQPSDP